MEMRRVVWFRHARLKISERKPGMGMDDGARVWAFREGERHLKVGAIVSIGRYRPWKRKRRRKNKTRYQGSITRGSIVKTLACWSPRLFRGFCYLQRGSVHKHRQLKYNCIPQGYTKRVNRREKSISHSDGKIACSKCRPEPGYKGMHPTPMICNQE
ncbi:hypothetical protein LX32DRAFT_436703 [Colletotrichum zoysiae]|uniref:Uncharacterized protein n=1 Tax=Colletotrichum zoysiae TaxID=1216348 RepID=A0AAD9M046_9PEZI|nr:hypothetical protein LX32DRAFT_436703 [Colletotrichum zoysiae]